MEADGFSREQIDEFIRQEQEALILSGREPERKPFTLQPDNVPAWQVFAESADPRMGEYGIQAIDRAVAMKLVEWEHEGRKERKELFSEIRIIERAALQELRKK